MNYIYIDNNQARILIDAKQSFESLKSAYVDAKKYAGSMFWRESNGSEYLTHSPARKIQKSLGPRNAETEAILSSFTLNKLNTKNKLDAMLEQQSEHARMISAVHLNRVPLIVAQLSRKLKQIPKLANTTLIVGTNALYAYEAGTGVKFVSGIVATRDVDVLWDTRRKVSIVTQEPKGFIGILQSIDKSFSVVGGKGSFTASNDKGFMVDLIHPLGKNPHKHRNAVMSDFTDDLVAVQVKGLEWLISCPRYNAVAFDEKGYPVEMTVPDPRAFAMHKLWLSQQPDRDPIKKSRDREQAEAVFHLVQEKMPLLSFSDVALNALPFSVKKQASYDFGFSL